MRWVVLIALLAAGCRQEPSFDERYAQTQRKLEAKASTIDAELAASASDAAAVESEASAAPD